MFAKALAIALLTHLSTPAIHFKKMECKPAGRSYMSAQFMCEASVQDKRNRYIDRWKGLVLADGTVIAYLLY